MSKSATEALLCHSSSVSSPESESSTLHLKAVRNQTEQHEMGRTNVLEGVSK
jgi:hypothetical protein